MNSIRHDDITSDLPPASATRAPLAATMVRPALPPYVLRGVGGAGFGRTFPLVGPTVLGRDTDCGIRLDLPGVSRHHVRLTPTAEGLLIEDLGSTNGWLLNEAPKDRAWARHGDEIGIDVMRFRVVAPAEAQAQPQPQQARSRSARDVLRARGASPWWWVAALAVLASAAALALRQAG